MNDYNKINGGFLSPDYIPIKERNKDEMINELKCEVNRLNNIINEIEDYTKAHIEVCENRLSSPFCNFEKATKELSIFQNYLDKLKELKESGNNE